MTPQPHTTPNDPGKRRTQNIPQNTPKETTTIHPNPQFRLTPLKPALPRGTATTLPVLLTITGPATPALQERAPISLALVLDRSGSMSGEPLRHAKLAARSVVEALGPQDRVSIITFDHDAQFVTPTTTVATEADKAKVLMEIQSIDEGGSTNLVAGWELGVEAAAPFADGRTNTRVLVLTDGHHNAGPVQDRAEIGKMVSRLAQTGVTTSTVGLGLQHDEDMLEAIAAAGNGRFLFAEGPTSIEPFFDQELRGLQSTVARQVSLGITGLEGTVPGRVLNGLTVLTTRRYAVPDVQAEKEITIVFELAIPALDADSDVARLRLAWDTPGEKVRKETFLTLRLPVVDATEWDKLPEDEAVRARIVSLETVADQRTLSTHLKAGRTRQATNTLDFMRQKLDQMPEGPSRDKLAYDLAQLEQSVRRRDWETARKRSSSSAYLSSRDMMTPDKEAWLRQREEQRRQRDEALRQARGSTPSPDIQQVDPDDVQGPSAQA